MQNNPKLKAEGEPRPRRRDCTVGRPAHGLGDVIKGAGRSS